MARTPNDGLYGNLYDKDMSLMRKLMNLDEFQCPSNGGNNTAPNGDINATKQFHSYTNGNNGSGSIFNGKFANATNFTATSTSFPQNGIRNHHHHHHHHHHDGLLKPCYDFASTPKTEPLDDNFASNNSSIVGFKKQQQQQQQPSNASVLFATTGGGFMNQYPHETLFGANNNNALHQQQQQQSFQSKMNEINNNNNNNNSNSNSNNNNGGGILIKLENGVSIDHLRGSTIASTTSNNNNNSNKTEPNEFRSNINHVKDSVDNVNDDERKNILTASNSLRDDSNDGFTQL
jgi:hypothetical protein